jgi:uncharacterized protein (TIGR02996 family)
MNEQALLEATLANPVEDLATWLVLADWLEEHHQPERAELVRLGHDPHYRPDLSPAEKARRARQLLREGVRPCVATRTAPAGLTMALIPAGSFAMGSPPDEVGRQEAEGPVHRVTISRAFFLGIWPVTVGQFRAFIDQTGWQTDAESQGGSALWRQEQWVFDPQANWRNPGFSQGDDHPVVCVSWNDARAFCHWLFEQDPAYLYRLPTEAEWEWACRTWAGQKPFHSGDVLGADLANCDGEEAPYGGAPPWAFLARTTRAGSYPPNAWGLHDLHGNVLEWCHDRYAADYYPNSPGEDPAGPQDGFEWVIWFDVNNLGRPPLAPSRRSDGARSLRGGSWLADAAFCRSACRHSMPPHRSACTTGFRVAALRRPAQ